MSRFADTESTPNDIEFEQLDNSSIGQEAFMNRLKFLRDENRHLELRDDLIEYLWDNRTD